jgi:WhiB family transcriptional regulator, redox-sensing transcriptional regulator
MSVLFSELLVPGWAEGPTAKIGLGDVTWAFDEAPVITYKDYKRTDNSTVGVGSEIKASEIKSSANKSPAIKSMKVVIPCHSADPELFFSEEKEAIAQAKTLCGGCPMKAKCLTGALSRAEPAGVWGGELFDDGQVIQAKRMPGRPAKVAS